jgi:hypothetical protein
VKSNWPVDGWTDWVLFTYVSRVTAVLLNFFFVRKPPPATAVPASAATKATIATNIAALGRRRRTFFIRTPFP